MVALRALAKLRRFPGSQPSSECVWGFVHPPGTRVDFQFGATGHTVTGSVPSGEGAWGTETHTPTRFYFKNDSNQIWRLGTMSMTGAITTGSTGLGASRTNYFRPSARRPLTT